MLYGKRLYVGEPVLLFTRELTGRVVFTPSWPIIVEMQIMNMSGQIFMDVYIDIPKNLSRC